MPAAPVPSVHSLATRVAELERENARLEKINQVLMDRVERSMDLQGNAYSLFQTAIVLEAKVGERTQALEQALDDLETANLRLEKLNDELERRVAERTQDLSRMVADKETLLRELHHRVKNNLQTICSLLLIKSRQFQDSSLRQAFSDTLARVMAMSLVHETLYTHESSTQIDFSAYLRQLAEGLASTYGVGDRMRLEFGAGHVYLDLAHAIPVGLIAVEAISNAMKHAFPDGRSGRIWIDIQEIAKGKELVIADDGIGGGGESLSARGAGTGLMTALAGQVDGVLSWQRQGGTIMSLVFA